VVEKLFHGGAVAAVTLVLALAAAPPARPQSYPSRPIHMIVGYAPGGTGDILGRIIANQLGSELGQSVIVENRAGAGGTIAEHDVVNSTPDGYTILVGQTPEIAVNPTLMKDVGYDPLKDPAPIALAGVVPLHSVGRIFCPARHTARRDGAAQCRNQQGDC
jgi:tripartite-type tricarboxylate transporter receptor subunit TctC